MRRRSLLRTAAFVLVVAAAWLRFPAVGRGETPPTDVDPATLVRALGDPAERVRFQAMAELMRIGRPATRELAQALLDVKPIADRSTVSRSDLAFAVLIHASDVDVDALLDVYRSAPPETIEPPGVLEIGTKEVPPRRRIRMLLERLPTKLTGHAYEAFQGGDPALRVTLAGVMARAGPEDAGAIPFLAKSVVEDSHAEVRTAAANALARISESGPQALRSLLGHTDPRVRAVALAAYPANSADSAELVARFLKDPVREVRRTALDRIWVRYDEDNPCQRSTNGQPASALLASLPGSAIPDIVAFARDADEPTRWVAVQTLGSLACARPGLAPAMVQALVAELSDPSEDVADGHAEGRATTAYALARIPESGPQALRALLEHTDPRVRVAALAAYPENEEDSGELVARFLKTDPVREVRRTALDRIWEPEVPALIDLAKYDYDLRNPCRRARNWQPASALLAGFPSSALPGIVSFTHDSDERTRWISVQALGSLACARRDLAPAIADALVVHISDPAERVAAASLDRLATLAELNLVPRSPEALDKLFARLAEPSARHTEILAILERMYLPEERRNETVDALVTECLSNPWGWACRRAHSILSARPGWREAAVGALAARYSDVRSFDHRAWSALEGLGMDGSASAKLLERLLDHPEKGVRDSAATALAKRGYAPGRIWDVLVEGARSFDGGWGWERDATQALARLGEPGVARLIAILRDPATKQPARKAILDALSKVAAESPQAADFLLATAASAADPEAQAAAIQALAAIKSRPVDVKAALERAFATGNAEARSAVVWVWKETGQAPGDLVTRAFADPAPGVRKRAFTLLSLLPGDDPRRLTFTAAALQDKDVRAEALRFASELRERGSALLGQYAAHGEPLTDRFFDGVERLDSVDDTLLRALEARVADAPAGELDRILPILDRAGTEAPEERKRLYTLLDTDPEECEFAAQALLTLREDPWARDGHLAAALMDAGVHRIVQERLSSALDLLRSESASGVGRNFNVIIGASEFVFTMPRIPWPPPPGYKPVVVPRELFAATGSTTLGDVYKQLVGSLEAVSQGFEHGLFLGPPDGFALVARMERIRPDGTPFPEPARWLKEGSPKLSLMDLLADLFFEDPGYFRVIVFAVTSDLVPRHNTRAVLPELDDGAPEIPAELARQPFEGKEVLALVYSFERRRDAKVTPWEDGAPSARQHLEKAGVWARLGNSARR